MGPINKEVMHIGETPGKSHVLFHFREEDQGLKSLL